MSKSIIGSWRPPFERALRPEIALAPSAGLADVGVVGNGQVSALVHANGNVVWCCWPRPDSDPIFCQLLMGGAAPATRGVYSIEVVGQTECSLLYRRNTAILESTAQDERGNAIRITTWCPRFLRNGHLYRPAMLIRRIEPIAGRPTVRIRVHPAGNYGEYALACHLGTHHVRFLGAGHALRLTTDGSIAYLSEERVFVLDRPVHLVFSDDEPLPGPAHQVARDTLEATAHHWLEWVRGLSIPFDWQDAVIRAAITLQLATFEDTGAVIAAATTSIPEASDGKGAWDHRFCWLRDAHGVMRALNRLGAVGSVESYLRFLDDIVERESESLLQSVYGLSGERDLQERQIASLDGWQGHVPVRVGNAAHQQRHHDVYGAIILASAQSFHDQRLERVGGEALFKRLEVLGERAARLFDRPDAGLWESRVAPRAHTHSAAMCWAACDRLARMARRLGFAQRERYWAHLATSLASQILRRSWREKRGSYSALLDDEAVDASLLLLPELGMLDWNDARFRRTLERVEQELRIGDFLLRSGPSASENAYATCSFWWANALARTGRIEAAREAFEQILAARNSVGLLAERVDPDTRALWGNFPHTASMAGVIATASRLSRPWEDAI